MKSNESPAPVDEPAQEAPAPILATNASALIEKLYERRTSVRTLIIASVDDKGRSTVDFTSPMQAPALSHLRTSIEAKLLRYYSAAMFQAAPTPGPLGAVQVPASQSEVPRNVRRMIQKAQKRAHKRQGGNSG